MKAAVQRVGWAKVSVNGEVVSRIGHGLLVLLGVSVEDSAADAQAIASKIAGLRIFADDGGMMNLSFAEAGGEVLVISQFTLYGDVRRGRRPSFIEAAPPEIASPLIDQVCQAMRSQGIAVSEGSFGTHMEVELLNDGPVTLIVETRQGKFV